jgi:E3 ubiquitin-protein ligase UBR3
MLSTEFYSKKIKDEPESSNIYSHVNFTQIASTSSNDIVLPFVYKNTIKKPSYNNILNEFVFWWIKLDFPSDLAKFLVNLLTEHDFRIEMTISFVKHYLLITKHILERGKININMYLLSAQLYVAETGTKKVLEEHNLLETLLSSFHYLLHESNIMKISTFEKFQKELTFPIKERFSVVDVNNQLLHAHIYSGPLHDLMNFLAHKIVTVRLFEDSILIKLWLQSLSCFQATNLTERLIHMHDQYDHRIGYRCSIEVEYHLLACLWTLIYKLDDESSRYLTIKGIQETETILLHWLKIAGVMSSSYGNIKRPNPNQLTFNLPLHRFYSLLLFQLVFKQEGNLAYIMIYGDLTLLSLFSFPLQAQIGFYEVGCNMWVRNGVQLKEQAILYKKAVLVDPDLFLLQIILSRFNDFDLLMKVLIDRFHVNRNFKIKTSDTEEVEEPVKINNKYEFISMDLNMQHAMLNGLLVFLAQLICIKPNLTELDDNDLIRREIVNVICMAPFSYSQIHAVIDDFYRIRKFKSNFDDMINELADLKKPTLELNRNGIKQAFYLPKDFVWLEEYDPLYVLLRCGELSVYQKSFERYDEFIKSKNLNKDLVDNNLWQPFRLPKIKNQKSIDYEFLLLKMSILETKTLHWLLFNLLYKHFYETQLPEKTVTLIVFIIELTLYKVKINSL